MGRPREFDVNHALDKAIEVFWRHGYEGASVADLTEAMGINPPSLYAAFGNKEGLFRRAIDRYVEYHGAYWNRALEAPTARAMVETLLHGCADFLSQEGNPPGCLFVRSTASCGGATDEIRRKLTARRAEGEARLRKRLENADANGELPPGLDPAEFARYVLTVIEGMSVQAAAGANREQLHGVADMALRTWPA